MFRQSPFSSPQYGSVDLSPDMEADGASEDEQPSSLLNYDDHRMTDESSQSQYPRTLADTYEMKKRSPEGELLKKIRELQRKNKARYLNNEVMMAVYQQLLNVKK